MYMYYVLYIMLEHTIGKRSKPPYRQSLYRLRPGGVPRREAPAPPDAPPGVLEAQEPDTTTTTTTTTPTTAANNNNHHHHNT